MTSHLWHVLVITPISPRGFLTTDCINTHTPAAPPNHSTREEDDDDDDDEGDSFHEIPPSPSLSLPPLSTTNPQLLSLNLEFSLYLQRIVGSLPSPLMTKIYPNSLSGTPSLRTDEAGGVGDAAVLTVWRKSLLFNGNGFTVFDARGNLVFRVDNYACGNRAKVLLMDAAGNPLLTIRRKKLSLGEQWLVYDGETAANPRFSVRKLHHAHLRHSKQLAQVTPCPGSGGGERWGNLVVEGSYSQRCCTVYDQQKRQKAEIRRKEGVKGVGLGDDVFRLVVQPGLSAAVAMSLVILLDQMFG